MRGFVLLEQARADDSLLQLGDDVILLQRAQADEDGDAVAVERDPAGGADMEGERGERNGVGPLQPREVDAVAEQQGAGGQSGGG